MLPISCGCPVSDGSCNRVSEQYGNKKQQHTAPPTCSRQSICLLISNVHLQIQQFEPSLEANSLSSPEGRLIRRGEAASKLYCHFQLCLHRSKKKPCRISTYMTSFIPKIMQTKLKLAISYAAHSIPDKSMLVQVCVCRSRPVHCSALERVHERAWPHAASGSFPGTTRLFQRLRRPDEEQQLEQRAMGSSHDCLWSVWSQAGVHSSGVLCCAQIRACMWQALRCMKG